MDIDSANKGYRDDASGDEYALNDIVMNNGIISKSIAFEINSKVITNTDYSSLPRRFEKRFKWKLFLKCSRTSALVYSQGHNNIPIDLLIH